MGRDRKYLEDFKELYAGVVVSAHIAAYHRSLVSEFFQEHKITFFIDPMTYVFGRNIEKIKKDDHLKKSFEKLVLAHADAGILDISLNEKRSLSPSDFKKNEILDENILNKLSKSVLHFQKNLISKQKQTTLWELQELAGMSIEREIVKPLFLAAPYFFSEEYGDDWYKISNKLAISSKKFKEKYDLFPVICISKSLLQDDIIPRIIEDYQGFDGFIVWVADLNEVKADAKDLIQYNKFILALNKLGKPIYLLYGGYFSAILSKEPLITYCSGICYGETKDIDAPSVTGGGLMRYYIPTVHLKIPIEKARRFYVEYPHLLCNCKTCAEIRKNIKSKGIESVHKFFDLLESSDWHLKSHYVLTRYDELVKISKSTKADLIEQIKQNIAAQDKLKLQMFDINNRHLKNWVEVLRI